MDRVHRPASLAAVLCPTTADLRPAVRAAVERAGWEVAWEVGRWHELLEIALLEPVGVLVVDLTLSGALGARLVALLRDAAPDALVVVLAPDALQVAEFGVDAADVVPVRDLRQLTRRLQVGAGAATGSRSSKPLPA
ncbi:hypothetical protein [Egicoccus halophilus]|uniref:Response regulatory domain-containing protein n=1 Tax=Egicoccus halophilus TaxID=1670830 RepID=A0A8J3ETZ7_9ACTN|nr:hypothetical protein [Egicoccus halophilus]GGI06097.1 hypothetical protein GCM10011354_17400 [Egicoccus halophilus]